MSLSHSLSLLKALYPPHRPSTPPLSRNLYKVLSLPSFPRIATSSHLTPRVVFILREELLSTQALPLQLFPSIPRSLAPAILNPDAVPFMPFLQVGERSVSVEILGWSCATWVAAGGGGERGNRSSGGEKVSVVARSLWVGVAAKGRLGC